jgi:hypothetical protein
MFASAKIGSYCRGTKELQEKPVLRGHSIPPVLNIPKLLRNQHLGKFRAWRPEAFEYHGGRATPDWQKEILE